MADDHDPHRMLTILVQSLRRTIEERPPRGIGSLSTQQWRRALLAFEEVRVILRQAGRGGSQRPLDFDLVQEAHEKLLAIASDAELMDAVDGARLLIMPLSQRERGLAEGFRGIAATQALHVAIDISGTMAAGQQRTLELSSADELSAGEFKRLERLIPGQKVSPAKFAVVQSKVVLLPQNHAPAKSDAANADAARVHLRAQGDRIVSALRDSNCDRRLIEGLEALQQKLSESANIIELGLTNIGCEAMCKMAKSELPDAVSGMLQGHTASVAMYVAQFPEWQAFSENAAAAELGPQDIDEINRAAGEIASRLEQRPDLADPEVPRTIRAIRAFTADPGATLKKSAFALLRTVENFVATIFTFGADFLGNTIKKTADGLSDAAAKAAVVVLMSAALAAASQMTGVTARVSEAGWIKNAVEIVQRQIGGAD